MITHPLDPLANLRLSIDAQRVAGAAIHRLAYEVVGDRRLLTGDSARTPLAADPGVGRL
ncbi:MAG: hypothetical protein ACLP52_27980 [Streptosporangiaceae bacterium]